MPFILRTVKETTMGDDQVLRIKALEVASAPGTGNEDTAAVVASARIYYQFLSAQTTNTQENADGK
jgi:hypothetical protein